ncbi:MAG: hypothetical protein IKB86_01960 [Clostridia bacterium]|nr:hypothetical protein [Clostridia bacterium]
MFINYAHRGASEYAPENTVASFDLGIKMGADGIETDVQRTRDGEMVLFHNDKLDGRCSCTGKIEDYTLAELKEMDFGSWKDEKYAGEKITTLEEFAERYFHLDLTFAIELKSCGCEEKTLEIIKRYNAMDKVYVSSFQFEFLEEMRSLDKDIRLSWLILEPINKETCEKLLSIGGVQICPKTEVTEKEHVELAKSMGLEVRLWGTFTTELMKKACTLGVEGTTINFPDKLKEYLDK